jgi:hypothetical protein
VARAGNLKRVFSSDMASARAMLHQHVKKLVLVPTNTATGPIYEVLGETLTFSLPNILQNGL